MGKSNGQWSGQLRSPILAAHEANGGCSIVIASLRSMSMISTNLEFLHAISVSVLRISKVASLIANGLASLRSPILAVHEQMGAVVVNYINRAVVLGHI